MTFYKFRHGKIKEWMQLEEPLLIGQFRDRPDRNFGMGRIRYSYNMWTYRWCAKEFHDVWTAKGFHRRVAFMKNLSWERKLPLTQFMIMDLFGETPYGKLREKFTQP